MKILHTSDWHLGRSLYGKKRYAEFSAFLHWLIDTINSEQIDILLVAGDVFDNCTPSNQAQSLYYQFLHQVATSYCRHVVIIAGNHDSPSFLNAPQALLQAFHIYVVAKADDAFAEEVIELYHNEQLEAIICAVPYLRDRDIRKLEPGESIDEKNSQLVKGLKAHYQQVFAIADKKRQLWLNKTHQDIPIIAMGHLFTAGGKTLDGDGVRELYVGSLAHIHKEVFPSGIDYLALGHLHVAQKVGHCEHIRYCGSPIPMGFSEANQQKQVLLVTFNQSRQAVVDALVIPCFQPLERIVGSLAMIDQKIDQLKQSNSHAWLEIEYKGEELISDLADKIDERLIGSNLEVRRIKNHQVADRFMSRLSGEILDDLSVNDVFERCLDAFDVTEEKRAELMISYQEIVKELHEMDSNE